MSKKLEGKTVPITTVAAVVKDQMLSLTNRIAVAADDIAAGGTGDAWVEGVFDLPAVAAEVHAQGDLLYLDVALQQITSVAAGNILAGWAFLPKIAGAATLRIKLNG